MVLVSYSEFSNILLSLHRWAILKSLILQSTLLNEKQLEKISTNQKPGEIQRIKRRKNSIKMIISVYNETFDFKSLLGG